MKTVSTLSTFEKFEFIELCKEIFRTYIKLNDLANPLRYTTPLYPIINATNEKLDFLYEDNVLFTYNVISYDTNPSGPVALIGSNLDLFQSYYFENTPSNRQDAIKLLEKTLFESLRSIFKYIEIKDNCNNFIQVNYIFLSNLDLDLAEFDYNSWIDTQLNQYYPNVHFQIGTSISILSNLNTFENVKEKYLNIVNKQQSLIILPTETGLQVVPIAYLGLNRITDISAIEPCNIFVRSEQRIIEFDNAVDEFNELLKSPRISEEKFQAFFERHPIFLTGFSYKSIRSKVVLEREKDDPLIPDFFLEPASHKYWDIIDIKKPTTKIIIPKKNRQRFSANVFEAVAQMRTYGNYFDDPKHREWLSREYGIQ